MTTFAKFFDARTGITYDRFYFCDIFHLALFCYQQDFAFDEFGASNCSYLVKLFDGVYTAKENAICLYDKYYRRWDSIASIPANYREDWIEYKNCFLLHSEIKDVLKNVDGDWIPREDVVSLYDGTECNIENTVLLANGKRARKDDDRLIEFACEYYIDRIPSDTILFKKLQLRCWESNFCTLSKDGKIYSVNKFGKQKPVKPQTLESDTKFVALYNHLFPIRAKIVRGKKIHHAFENGRRPGSCMRSDEKHDANGHNYAKRTLYSRNPDKVGAVYIESCDSYASSNCCALFWITEEAIYIDRLYQNGFSKLASREFIIQCFAKTLEEKFNRPVMSIHSSSNYGLEYCSKKLSFRLKFNHSKLLPYIDTFCYVTADDDDDYVIVHNYEPRHQLYVVADSVFGKSVHDYDSGSYCACCGNIFLDDELEDIGGELWCEDCISENFSTCECCEERISDDVILNVDVRYSPGTAHPTFLCHYCFDTHYRHYIEEETEEYISYRSAGERLFSGGYTFWDDTIQLYDGKYASISEHMVVELHDGEYACHDCHDNIVELHDGRLAIDDDNIVQLHDGSYELA